MSTNFRVSMSRNSFFFFYHGFLSRTFAIHGTAGEGRGYLFNPSLPLPPASQILRLGNYCRELTSAHSLQTDPNREPLASESKSLTTKLRSRNSSSVITTSNYLTGCFVCSKPIRLLGMKTLYRTY